MLPQVAIGYTFDTASVLRVSGARYALAKHPSSLLSRAERGHDVARKTVGCSPSCMVPLRVQPFPEFQPKFSREDFEPIGGLQEDIHKIIPRWGHPAEWLKCRFGPPCHLAQPYSSHTLGCGGIISIHLRRGCQTPLLTCPSPSTTFTHAPSPNPSPTDPAFSPKLAVLSVPAASSNWPKLSPSPNPTTTPSPPMATRHHLRSHPPSPLPNRPWLPQRRGVQAHA